MRGSLVTAVEIGGLAAIAEMLDSAVLSETVRDLVALARAPLVAEGAQVEVSPGHTLVATWPGPDHAFAAIRAALAVQKAIKDASRTAESRYGVRFWARIGVHATADDNLEETTVVALALKGHGRHDTVMISLPVRKQVRSEFHILPLSPASLLPGLPPAPTFEVAGLKVAKQAADRAPFVGRQAEGRQLLDLVKLVHHHGPQVVDLVGEAGMGKTRLAHELCGRVSRRGLGRVLRGWAHGVPDGTMHSVVASLLRSWLGVSSLALPEEVALRLRSGTAAFSLESAERAAALLGHLLGVDMPDPDVLSLSPFQKRAAAYRVWDQILSQMARQAFLLLFLDDLQWADDASLAWLHGMLLHLEDNPDLPILIVAAYRSEADRDLGEGFGPSRLRIVLDGLGRREGRRLGAGLLGLDGGLEAIAEPTVRQLIESAVDRAQGNPLYLSEIIQGLVDRGAIVRDQTGWHRGVALRELPVAASMQEAFADRLEQVDAVLLRTLQAASVVGRTFSPTLVAKALEVEDVQGLLAELVLADFVIEMDGGEYAFSHPAAQEVVYRSIAPAQRQALHREIARALEEIQNPSRQRNPVPVAWHYMLSDQPGQAIPHLAGAGERALAAHAPDEAISCFTRALDLLGSGSPAMPRERLLLGLAEAQAMTGRFGDAIRHLETVLALGPANGAFPGSSYLQLYGRLADVHRRAGDEAAARDAYERGLAEADASTLPQDRGMLHLGLSELALDAGDLAAAERSAREALGLLPSRDHPEEAGRGFLVLGRTHLRAGALAASVEAYRQAVSLCRRIRDLPGTATSLTELGGALRMQGDQLEARKVLEQAREAAAGIGDRRHEALTGLALAELCLDLGDTDEGMALLEAAHLGFLSCSDLAGMGLARLRLAEATLAAGDLAWAQSVVEDGMAIAGALGDKVLQDGLQAVAAQVRARVAQPKG